MTKMAVMPIYAPLPRHGVQRRMALVDNVSKNKCLEDKNGVIGTENSSFRDRKTGSKYVYTPKFFMSSSARCEEKYQSRTNGSINAHLTIAQV